MKECRKDRQKRLIEVYDHLRQHFGIHTKTGFSEAIKYGRTSLSAAMNGKEEYLTDDLFEKICEKYDGVFNLDYLLTGEGDLLTPHEDALASEIEENANKSSAFDNLVEIFSRVIRESDDMRVSMKTDMEEIRALKEDLHQAIYDFRDATYRLTQALKELNGNNTSVRPMDRAADEGDY